MPFAMKPSRWSVAEARVAVEIIVKGITRLGAVPVSVKFEEPEQMIDSRKKCTREH
jgi:hypothetical protein